jgi:YVTN family beta-propeller protein
MLRPVEYLIIFLMCMTSIFYIVSYAQPLSCRELIQNSAPQHVESEIPVDKSPMVVAINPKTNILYVANFGSDTVSVIDGKTERVLTTLHVIPSPAGIAVNPLTNKIYAINAGGEIAIIDGKTHRIDYLNANSSWPTTSVTNWSHTSPIGIVVNPYTNMIYAIDYMHDDLAIINGTTNRVENFTKIGPAHDLHAQIALNSLTDKIYVDGPDTNITVIDASYPYRKISSQAIGLSRLEGHVLGGITVNPKNNMLYVTNSDGSRVFVLNASSMHIIGTFINNGSSLNSLPSIAFDPVKNNYYVTWGDQLAVINGTGSLVKTLSVGIDPVYVAVNPTDHKVYVVNRGNDSLSVIDNKTDSFFTGDTVGSHTQSQSIGFQVDDYPTRIAVNSEMQKLYVTYGTSDEISVIDERTNGLINTVRVGYVPYDIAITPSTGRAYVTERDSKTVSVIDGDTNKLVDKVNMGPYPEKLLVDPINNLIFVSHGGPINGSSTSLQPPQVTSVVDGYTNDVIANLTTKDPTSSSYPGGSYMAFDQNKDRLYVVLSSSETSLASFNTFWLHSSQPGHWLSEVIQEEKEEIPRFTGESDISNIGVNPVTGILYATTDNTFTSPSIALALDEDTAPSVDRGDRVILSNITVGISPSSIVVNPPTHKVYIANSGSNNVSIIDAKTNKGITNVTVGNSPCCMAIDPKTNIVYVANSGSDTISMMNGSSDKIIAGIRLKVNPVNFGTISCNGRKISDDYILYDDASQVKCTASVNDTSGHTPFIGPLLDYISKGSIQFASWSEPSGDTNYSPNINFSALQYGTLTANFKQLPPPLPDWLLTAIIPIIISAVIALYKIVSRRTHKINAKEYEKKIQDIYNTLSQNREECLRRLDDKRRQITELFTKGKLSRKNYELLDNTISYYENRMFKL